MWRCCGTLSICSLGRIQQPVIFHCQQSMLSVSSQWRALTESQPDLWRVQTLPLKGHLTTCSPGELNWVMITWGYPGYLYLNSIWCLKSGIQGGTQWKKTKWGGPRPASLPSKSFSSELKIPLYKYLLVWDAMCNSIIVFGFLNFPPNNGRKGH